MRFALEDLFADVPAEQVAEARAFYRARVAGRGPASFEELEAVRARRSAPPAADPPAIKEMAEAAGARVPVRVFLPSGGAPRGVHLDIHSGGFYMDTAAHGDVRNRAIAEALNSVVVSVDYRLAPRAPLARGTRRLRDGGALARRAGRGPVRDLAADDRRQLRRGHPSPGHPATAQGPGFPGRPERPRRRSPGEPVRRRAEPANMIGRFTGAVLQFGTYDMSALTPA